MCQALPPAVGPGRDAWPCGGESLHTQRARAVAEPDGQRGLSGSGAPVPDLERLPSKRSGRSPGNFDWLVFVFLPAPRSPWPPCRSGSRVCTPDSVHLLPRFVLPSLPLCAKRWLACSQIPILACWKDRGFSWNPPCQSPLSKHAPCGLPHFPRGYSVRLVQYQLLLSVLSPFFLKKKDFIYFIF